MSGDHCRVPQLRMLFPMVPGKSALGGLGQRAKPSEDESKKKRQLGKTEGGSPMPDPLQQAEDGGGFVSTPNSPSRSPHPAFTSPKLR